MKTGIYMTTVKLNYVMLLQELERKKNRRYKYSDIANLTGLSRQTATKLFSGKAQAVDLDTLGKLIDFFAAEGMPVKVGDFFTVD